MDARGHGPSLRRVCSEPEVAMTRRNAGMNARGRRRRKKRRKMRRRGDEKEESRPHAAVA